MNTAGNVVTEAQILERVVMPDEPNLSPEAARAILGLGFDQPAVKRMNELADKNGIGTLTHAERHEMETYLRVGNFLNLLQAKARLSLAQSD